MDYAHTLANIYFPNTKQVTFICDITTNLTSFQTGLGGDFNLPMDPLLDTSTGMSALTYRALRNIKLHDLLVHNNWNTLFHNDRDYTHHSASHKRYARLDYFFLLQRDLLLLKQATIEPMFLSDYHPIILTLAFPEVIARSPVWHLNATLLTNKVTSDHLHSHIQAYFLENYTPDVPTS